MANTPLNDLELKALDKEIDQHKGKLSLIRRPKLPALVHVLTCFDEQMNAIPEDGKALAASIFDGLDFAVRWVYEAPTVLGELTSRRRHKVLFAEAQQLLTSATDYSDMFYIMSMLFNGHAVGERCDSGIVKVRLTNDRFLPYDVAGKLLSPKMSRRATEAIAAAKASFDSNDFCRRASVRILGEGRVSYDAQPVFSYFQEHQSKIYGVTWDLPEAWDLGGYTVGDFRRCWVALTSLVWIHMNACDSFPSPEASGTAAVIIRQRTRWVNQLCGFSGLPDSVVTAILNDLIYDSAQQQSSPVEQPFLPLPNGLLLLTGWVVVFADGERNLIKTVQVRRPAIMDMLKNKKEADWLNELEARFSELEWDTYRDIEFTHEGKNSQIDLLVIDERERFGLGLELKWLTEPDSASETRGFEAEMRKGIQLQARPAAGWLNSNKPQLASRLSCQPSELNDLQFRSAVLIRPGFGTGLTYDPEVPILNGDLLESMIQSIGPNLRTIWTVAQKAEFFPVEGIHFEVTDSEFRFGDIRFEATGFGSKPIKSWDLETALRSSR